MVSQRRCKEMHAKIFEPTINHFVLSYINIANFFPEIFLFRSKDHKMKTTTKHSFERGQALVLIALAAIGLFGIAGLAIDGSIKFSDRRHAQNAADSAALAAALAKVRGDTLWKSVGVYRAADNGYDNNHVTNDVYAYLCTDADASCGPYTGDANYVQVVITSDVNTFFARIVGITQTHNTVQAVAMSDQESTEELYGGASIVGLAPDECETIYFSGS